MESQWAKIHRHGSELETEISSKRRSLLRASTVAADTDSSKDIVHPRLAVISKTPWAVVSEKQKQKKKKEGQDRKGSCVRASTPS